MILVKKSGSNDFLSSSALDYYNRFAKNRGIERYFRSSKISRSNRASSDTSLNEKNEFSETQNISSEFAKSLNNINISDCELKGKADESTLGFETLSSSDEKSFEYKEEKAIQKIKHVKRNKPMPTQHSVKESSTMTDTQSDKHVNLNLQSKIEIILPPQPMPIPPIATKLLNSETNQNQPMPVTSSYTEPPQIPQLFALPKILYCAETQTSDNVSEMVDEPIKPNVKLNVDVSRQDDLDASPNESVTSKEQRLEWDSLADVGYNPFLICDKSGLSSTERKAIKSYMSKRGLTSTDNIIVLKNSPGKQNEIPKSKKRQESRRSLPYNDNWMEIYTKYKDKYSTDVNKTLSKPFKPDAQSTPLDQQSLRFAEKSAQTSLINLLCKSVQVQTATQQKEGSNISVGITLPETFEKLPVESLGEDTNNTDFSLETGSFVFMTGSPKKSKTNSCISIPTCSNEVPEVGNKFETKTVEGDSLQSVKSQIKVKAISTNSLHNGSSTNESSTFEDKGKTSFEEELKMAVALMNSVVESKSMHNDMKKSLINKLVQKIIGLKISSQNFIEEDSKLREKLSSSNSNTFATSTDGKKHDPTPKGTTEKSSSSANSEQSERIPPTAKSQTSSKASKTNSDHPVSYESSSTLNKKELVEDFVMQTLKPMTHSEVDYENHKNKSHTSSLSSGNYASKECSSTISDNQEKMSKKAEKLISIEKEIDRLLKVKELMQFDLRKRKSKEKIYENVNACLTNSHKRSPQKKERFRLCTPTTLDQNLSNDLEKRKEKFMEYYENKRGKLYEFTGQSEVIYTKPYETKQSSNSELKTVVLSEKYKSRFRKSTSISSSDVTHPYDTLKLPNQNSNAVETQTTDSLKRIAPYFESKTRIVKDGQKTQIVYKTKHNKQIQTSCLEPLAYSIVFENTGTREPKNTLNKNYQTEKEIREKETEDPQIDTRTLKEHLNDNRPVIFQTMNQRNECIRELRRLRKLRNEQRKKLLLLTSETSLKEKIRAMPPSPLGTFSRGFLILF